MQDDMRVFPQELFIRKLKGTEPKHLELKWLAEMSIDECLAELRTIAGVDLGTDPNAWEAWWLQ
jgi:hypothetical protein